MSEICILLEVSEGILFMYLLKTYITNQKALFVPLLNITDRHAFTEEVKEKQFLASEIRKQWNCAECFYSTKPSLCMGIRLPLCRKSCDYKCNCEVCPKPCCCSPFVICSSCQDFLLQFVLQPFSDGLGETWQTSFFKFFFPQATM